jgi:hypothetical protein
LISRPDKADRAFIHDNIGGEKWVHSKFRT